MAIKADDYIFGAYFSHPISLSGSWSGSPSSFLFSSTLGLKFPYHGHNMPDAEDPTFGGNNNGDESTSGGGGGENQSSTQPAGFFADLDQFLIGYGDIVINSNLTRGSTQLENCYGFGLDVECEEAKYLLAGSEKFTIDTIEFWSIQ